nr:DpnII family type II restriction endonuclease [Phocaeicola plebeius]
MRDFDSWLASFRPSIADYKYYTDFNKVFNNNTSVNFYRKIKS